jgi:hypothetical protein
MPVSLQSPATVSKSASESEDAVDDNPIDQIDVFHGRISRRPPVSFEI